MNVATLTAPNPWNAFQEYRAAVKARYSEEDATLMRAYRTLCHGRKVLDLFAVIKDAGLDPAGRPKLAICRADAERVSFDRYGNGSASFWSGDQRRNAAQGRRIRLPASTFPRVQPEANTSCVARVPLIPPAYRPAGSLDRYHLLWEADWTSVPKDPILLRHLGKNLYAVLAAWELTPVEQAILRAR